MDTRYDALGGVGMLANAAGIWTLGLGGDAGGSGKSKSNRSSRSLYPCCRSVVRFHLDTIGHRCRCRSAPLPLAIGTTKNKNKHIQFINKAGSVSSVPLATGPLPAGKARSCAMELGGELIARRRWMSTRVGDYVWMVVQVGGDEVKWGGIWDGGGGI